MRKSYLILILGAVLTALCSCGRYDKDKGPSSTSGTSLVFCDESFENIMEQEIDVFEYIYDYKTHVLAMYGTEAEAVDSLLALSYRTIVIPRELTDNEVALLKKKNRTPRTARIAVDAVALIVNPDNPADALSLKEISEILSGETTNWRELSPNYPDRPIAVLLDKPGSSMATYMRDSLLNGKKFSSNVYSQGSIQGVVDAVRKDKAAIGVIGVSWLTTDLQSVADVDSVKVAEVASDVKDVNTTVDGAAINDRISNSGVKALKVMSVDNPMGVRPFQQEIYSGAYPLTRSIYMTTVSPSGSPGGGFFSFVTSHDGQKVMMKTGVLPARMQINVVELVP